MSIDQQSSKSAESDYAQNHEGEIAEDVEKEIES